LRVLLIDDDRAFRQIARMMLERAGFEVAEAVGGAEGVRTFRQEGADVVLCDLFMPDVDGLEVIGELCHDGAHIVAMSGGYCNKLDLLNMARILGAVQVLHKPFDQEEVAHAIERAALAGA
jgi:CheY-like chemotaxis protein